MGGGPNKHYNNTYIPMIQQQQGIELSEQTQQRQQYNSRMNYTDSLYSPSESTVESIPSMYPHYDHSSEQLDPVPLTVIPPLPPRIVQTPPKPAAYRSLSTSSGVSTESSRISPESPRVSIQQPRVSIEQPRISSIESAPASPKPTSTKVQLIYTKSGFYLQDPTQIHGFFSILTRSLEARDILIAWIPEDLIEPHDIPHFLSIDGQLADSFPYIELSTCSDVMVISLKQIHSLYVCPPTEAVKGSIVVTARSGEMLKPLWFLEHNWPGYDILDILAHFTPLKKDTETMDVHIVDPQQQSVPASVIEDSSSSQNTTTLATTWSDVRWTLLERFSKITQSVSQVLEHPLPRLFQNTANEYQMASNYLSQYGTSTQHKANDEMDGLLVGMPELCGPAPIHTRTEAITPETWITLFDDEGRLACSVDEVNQRIFQGGLDPDIRIEAWKFLLGIYPWHSTFDDREAIRRSRADSYYAVKSTWFDHPEVRETKHFQDEKHRIDKDVHRTDRDQEAFVGDSWPNPDPQMAVGTNANLEVMKDILVSYNCHNTDLGYVQGMSDLLAPLFVAMGDEVMAFWTFTLFMQRVQSNFYQDQSGMHAQLNTLRGLVQFTDPQLHKHLEDTETINLFFCFRWLLVWFKREFEWQDVIRLWEVLWTDHLGDRFILFVALAVIDKHRQAILDLNQFDEVLRYVNDLTGNIELEETLERAEVLFYQFERKIRAMQHKKSMLQEQLQMRSVWNSPERPRIQDSIEKLLVPDSLLVLLP